MTALLIIDVQRDFIDGALPVPDAAAIVPVINELQDRYMLVAATADSHAEEDPEFADFPPHCVYGTPGAELHPGLDTTKVAEVFRKTHFSGFSHPGLRPWLKARGVTELHVVGLAIDFCVKATVLDALKAGLRVRVILDGCRGIDPKPAEMEMLEAGAELEIDGMVLDLGTECCRGTL